MSKGSALNLSQKECTRRRDVSERFEEICFASNVCRRWFVCPMCTVNSQAQGPSLGINLKILKHFNLLKPILFFGNGTVDKCFTI